MQIAISGTPKTNKQLERERIDQLTESFLADGNEIAEFSPTCRQDELIALKNRRDIAPKQRQKMIKELLKKMRGLP